MTCAVGQVLAQRVVLRGALAVPGGAADRRPPRDRTCRGDSQWWWRLRRPRRPSIRRSRPRSRFRRCRHRGCRAPRHPRRSASPSGAGAGYRCPSLRPAARTRTLPLALRSRRFPPRVRRRRPSTRPRRPRSRSPTGRSRQRRMRSAWPTPRRAGPTPSGPGENVSSAGPREAVGCAGDDLRPIGGDRDRAAEPVIRRAPEGVQGCRLGNVGPVRAGLREHIDQAPIGIAVDRRCRAPATAVDPSPETATEKPSWSPGPPPEAVNLATSTNGSTRSGY